MVQKLVTSYRYIPGDGAGGIFVPSKVVHVNVLLHGQEVNSKI
jgi:hypothetical protein